MGEELPAVTGQQTASTWDSALTSDEFAAVRSAGFEPVGQVFGAAVYGAGSASGPSCPTSGGSPGGATQARAAVDVPGHGALGSLGRLVQAMTAARHTAVDRMTAECAARGGDGVVGVRLSRGSFVLGGAQFAAIGTAVRAPGARPGPPAPFTCGLSGQDFAKLIMAGWVPAGLVLGISIGLRHDDRTTVGQTRWRSGNAEVAGWTELVGRSRREARDQLEADLRRLGAEGVVIATMQLQVRERDCPAQVGRRDHIAEATLVGTAIARFSAAGRPGARPALAIMRM